MIKIIYLEDDENDLELVRHNLKRELPDAEVHHAATAEKFRELIASVSPDVILTDLSVPGLTGTEAFSLANAIVPEVPVIFVSGTVKEDDVIDALQAGATDYVLKDRPKRLATAIKRAVRERQEHRERRLAEEQLIRAQRLENIGLLASGIAHDFNNILAPILMAAPLLRDRMVEDLDRKLLTTIEQCAVRGASLARHILSFARGSGDASQTVDVERVIRDIVAVGEYTFTKNIRLQMELAPGLWEIRGSPTHLHQVLLNLAVNARDAMPEGGTLSLRARNAEVDEIIAAGMSAARPGRFVHIEVQDTGSGIPTEVLDRIWDPFFTTKPEGRGTGLGLSTVRTIVERAGGFTEVRTTLGAGSTFHVYLPAIKDSAAPAQSSDPTRRKRGAGQLVLVVDDDVHIRDVIGATLSSAGYRIVTASDATEALAVFAPRMAEIKGVITDIEMPGMSGIDLAKVIRSLSDSAKILVITGVPEERDRDLARQHCDAVLLKPFSIDSLLSTMETVLR